MQIDILPQQSTDFSRRQSMNRAQMAPRSITLWYAPEVRQYVKAETGYWPQFEVVAMDPAETESLRIALVAPKDQATIAPTDPAVLTGRVTSGKGVSRVVVTVNGETVATQLPEGGPKRSVALKVPLTLRDGKNVVLVTATDANGTSTQEARTVVYEEPVAVRLPVAGESLRVNRAHLRLAIPMTIPARPSSVGPRTEDFCTVTAAVDGEVLDWFHCRDAAGGVGEVKLRLNPGANRLRIRFNEYGQERFEERVIVFDAGSSPTWIADASQKQRAEAQRVADEQRKRAEEQRLAEEQQKRAGEHRLAEEQRKRADEQRLAEEQRRRAEEQRAADAQRAAEAERAAADARRREDAQRLAALPPLQMKVSSPADQARVEHETIALAGLVSSAKGISRVVVSLNGVDVKRQEEKTPQRSIGLSVPITLREGQNTVVVTAAEPDGTVSQEVRTVHYEKAVPLTLAMRFPTENLLVREPSTMAAAVVTSSKGVAKAIVTVNGVEVHQQSDRTPPKSMLVTVPVQLRPGVNAVAVSVTEPDGTTRQEVRTVVYEPPVVAVVPAAPPPPKRERWAVVIGVGDYEHAGIPRLRYAVSDADAIYRTLIDFGGFKADNVLLLTDRSPRKPTLRNIKWALGTFLARSAQKDDTVLIFFAGHGAPEVDSRGMERDGFAKYLIPADADPDDLFSTALPMDDLQTIFSRIESDRLVAFLDSCYSGAAGGRTFATKRSRVISVDDTFLDRLTRGKGRAIVTASRTSEVSLELDDLRHGLFTYYLVEGLKGAADRDRDGVVTLQELYEYVGQRVTQKSRAVGGNQHPVMKGEVEGALPLMQLKTR